MASALGPGGGRGQTVKGGSRAREGSRFRKKAAEAAEGQDIELAMEISMPHERSSP